MNVLTSGPNYFPGWVSILFSVGLALGIVRHLPCIVLGRGSRWFHIGHAVMALSMIYMYLSMSYDWNWLPATWQMWFFVATSVVIAGWISAKVVRRQPINLLWTLLLIQHVAMAYMWYPMMRWNAVAIFVLVSWFAIEAFGWMANLLPPSGGECEGGCGGHADGVLVASDWTERALMAVMALSMGYMFYGMQLLR